jgi:cytochrome c553
MRDGFSPGRMIRVGLALAAMAVALPVGIVYGLSEWKLHRHFDAPLEALHVNAPPNLIEGERMARIVGCWDGCHGRTGQGGHEEIEGIVRNTAPTLSQVLPLYSDEELVRLVRYGLKRDGHSAVGMISYTFWSLGDQDLANIIAHLRRQPASPPMERKLELTWRGRLALATGEWKVSVEQVDRSRPRWGDLPQTTAFERGRYIASVTCTECHGLDFNGNALEHAPSLAILAMYSQEQFAHLMRTAEPVGGRKLDEEMDWVADAPFTDEEVVGLYQFLRVQHGLKP